MIPEEIRKRLEEAADKYAWSVWTNPMFLEEWNECKRDYIAGAEYGYKEAIKQAKEWLKQNLGSWDFTYFDDDDIADFEEAMNKLWEEKK